MTADREHPRGQILSSRLLEFLPEISLRHAQAIWLLNRAVGIKRGGSVNYFYYDLMELALALTVRVYYFVPDSVLAGIIRKAYPLGSGPTMGSDKGGRFG